MLVYECARVLLCMYVIAHARLPGRGRGRAFVCSTPAHAPRGLERSHAAMLHRLGMACTHWALNMVRVKVVGAGDCIIAS